LVWLRRLAVAVVLWHSQRTLAQYKDGRHQINVTDT